MRCALLQFGEDGIADAWRIPPQSRIPEPQRLDPERLQILFSECIMLLLVGVTVLAAIQFKIQLRLFAKEIQIVDTAGMLAAKLVAAKPTGAQPTPQEFFPPRINFAKLLGAFRFGHGWNLVDAVVAGKIVLKTALIPTFSPEEKEPRFVRPSLFVHPTD